MKLYWKNIEIPLGTSIKVVETGGDGYPRIWKIMEIREKISSDEYYDPQSKKSYPLTRVMKNKRLFRKSSGGELLHIPPCTFFLVIEETSQAGPSKKRCFNVDFLSTLLDVKIIAPA